MQATTEVIIYIGETELTRTATIEYEKFGPLVAITGVAFEDEAAGTTADVFDMITTDELEQVALDLGLTEDEDEADDE